MYRRCSDLTAAAWLVNSTATPQRLLTFGPATYPAYARLRYLPDPARPKMRESDAMVPAEHRPDIDVARSAIAALIKFSTSTTACFVCLWEGYGGQLRDSELLNGPMVTLPDRRYVLFTAQVADLDNWHELFDSPFNSPPSFVWPADHRWCFASDVDPHWAGIGSTTSVICQLVEERDLDVVVTDPNEPQPTYY